MNIYAQHRITQICLMRCAKNNFRTILIWFIEINFSNKFIPEVTKVRIWPSNPRGMAAYTKFLFSLIFLGFLVWPMVISNLESELFLILPNESGSLVS